MKIILENELEKWAWKVMMDAHYKWEKNYGEVLRDHMEWWFDELNKEEKEEAIKKEVERRLRDKFGEEFMDYSEDEYIRSEIEAFNYSRIKLDDEEKRELERELRDEYKEKQKEICEEKELMLELVEEKLYRIYYTFFNAPEKLKVICE
ncbi:MAG: hypothetical protein K6U74_01970 [Firmicutes bacterium]|nr:hypothetical protein [Bacillota bacterium]